MRFGRGPWNFIDFWDILDLKRAPKAGRFVRMIQDGKQQKKVGLALGGGGAKGFAHIGVIKTLVDAGIPIDYIAGTSMGALVGGYYAATKNIRRLEALAEHFDAKKLVPSREVIRDKNGIFFRDATVEKVLEEEFHNIKIEDLQIPFVAVATDARNGEEVHISKGRLVDAIRASASLPVVFSTVESGGRLLIDGGLSNPVPADVVRELGAEYVIAIDVSSRWINLPEEMTEVVDIYDVIMGAMTVIENQIAKRVLTGADIVLRPAVARFRWLSFSDAQEILKAGENETKYHLREIRRGAGYPKTYRTPIEEFMDFLFG